MKEVQVNAPNGNYPVVIGSGILARAAIDIKHTVGASTAFVVYDGKLPESFIDALQASLDAAGVRHAWMKVELTEATKDVYTYSTICEWLQEAGAERTSAVVAVGGGIVGDVAGFAAATYQRGVKFFQIPTTLLAMVDSSVGGKVAVNLNGRKNMVGSFHQPTGVYADVSVLASLDERQMLCGLSECIKHGILIGEDVFHWTTTNADRVKQHDREFLIELVHRNVAFKAGVVSADPTERDGRMLLNLGHTFGHAIEAIDNGLTLLHGEAVSIGVVAACHYSRSRGWCSPTLLPLVETAYMLAGLPTRLTPVFQASDLVQEMRRDKKSAYTKLRIIVPLSLGNCASYDTPTDDELKASFEYVMRMEATLL